MKSIWCGLYAPKTENNSFDNNTNLNNNNNNKNKNKNKNNKNNNKKKKLKKMIEPLYKL
jgi:hypothetical protein